MASNTVVGPLVGKLPPQAIDLEKAVLGAMLMERDVFSKVSVYIGEETFYVEAHQKIFRAIQELNSAFKPADLLTVTQQLLRNGHLEMVGGAFYLTELTDKVVGSVSVESHALILSQKALARNMIKLCLEYTEKFYDDREDVLEVFDCLGSDILKASLRSETGRQAVAIRDIFQQRLKVYEQPVEHGLTGITSGFRAVDALTGGWQNSDLIILAARPGMGKTAFALNLARNAAIPGQKPGVIFSLEMSNEQLVDRMVSAETEIYLEKIKKRNLNDTDWQIMHSRMNALVNSKVFIEDTPALNIQAFRSKAIRYKQKYGIAWIVVDYLQLMKGERGNKNGNREQEIASISQGLKAVAKELDIPVIALSQLSRNVENRPGMGKIPQLSDLRESGAIEQDADQVIFLFRPEYYDITEDPEGRPTKGQCHVVFAKNRHGDLDSAIITFNGAMMKFADMEVETYSSFNDGFAIQPNTGFDDEPF